MALATNQIFSGRVSETLVASAMLVKHNKTGSYWNSELQSFKSHSSFLLYQLLQGQQTHAIYLFRLFCSWLALFYNCEYIVTYIWMGNVVFCWSPKLLTLSFVGMSCLFSFGSCSEYWLEFGSLKLPPRTM